MKRYISVIFIIILIVSSLGCTDSPEPPGADIPRLILDYDMGVNETIIHVRGMEAIRYENMTLYLNNSEIVRNDGYSIEHRTDRTKFDLQVNVTRDENRYHFNATFTVRPEVEEDQLGNEVIFKVIHYESEEEYINQDDLPLIRRLDLAEEEVE